MVITALTRNQVYRQRYRGFESHPLRHRKSSVVRRGTFYPRWDSKGGSWRHAGGMTQPPWLFRRKRIPPAPPKRKDTQKRVFSFWRSAVCGADRAACGRELNVQDDVRRLVPHANRRRRLLRVRPPLMGFLHTFFLSENRNLCVRLDSKGLSRFKIAIASLGCDFVF